MLKFWRSLPNPITKTHQATVVVSTHFVSTDSMVVSGSHKVGLVAYNPPRKAVYTTYIYIYIDIAFLGGLYATDPTFYGNQKQKQRLMAALLSCSKSLILISKNPTAAARSFWSHPLLWSGLPTTTAGGGLKAICWRAYLGICSIPIGSCHHHLKVHNKDQFMQPFINMNMFPPPGGGTLSRLLVGVCY